METIKNAGNYVADKVQGATAATSKEANKEVAKDNNAGVGTRLQAAGDAISDKASETKHDASAETNKQKATH
ncbi:glucose-repressible gene protein [Podospora fimiseda]|uniref:Glucose-repressible gene protein n=1 Tax=Podospora fimiseda TaxID=252190 RepID=A0AAN7BRQ7_9PEZI|nr:glucose-repressible gene protein [Podospora fimiseda]